MPANQNIVGEVGLKVVPVDPAAQFQAGVDQIIKRLEKQAQFQIKASGLEDVQQQANNAGQAFANAAIQAAGLTAAIYGIKASVEGAIQKLSNLFDQLAQARAGFTSILHSEAAGGQLLDDIREFARVSPFVTQELVNYSQQLLGVGLNAQKIIPLLKSTGDIISSVGGDTQNLGRVLFTLTQIKSIGSLKGQDTLQLQNSLIPITKYLSEYLHKSTADIVKLREAGLITADTVFNALNQQGEKVKGAMDRATRNIAGAKAILSDTITQLFQNQPVLNEIFTDVYKSIQKFADSLSKTEFQNAFAQFFDGVNKLYNGLKPILSALAGISNSGAITGMQALGSALGAIGEALSAIPQVAVEAFARLIAAIITVRAPLLLIKYVQSIQTLARSIIPATTGLAKMTTAQNVQAESAAAATGAIKAETAAIEMQNKALAASAAVRNRTLGEGVEGPVLLPKQGLLGRGVSKVGSAVDKLGGGGLLAAYGATLVGTYLQQQKNTGLKTAGGALQGAGTGFLIGGPAGAAIGAAIGGITSYLGAEDAKIKKHIEEMKQLGKDNAKAFIDATNEEFNNNVTGDSFKAFAKKIQETSDELGAVQKRGFGIGGITANESKITELTAQLQALQGAKAAAFDPINFGIQTVVQNLSAGTAGFEALTTSARGGLHRLATTDLVQVEAAAKKYGFTLDQLGDPEQQENIVTLIKNFDGLTTAQQQATAAAAKLVDAFDTAKKAASGAFDNQEKVFGNQIEVIASRQTALTAAFASGSAQNDQTKYLQFQEAALKAQETAFAVQTAKDAAGLDALKERIRLSSQGDPEAAKAGAETLATATSAAANRADAAGKLANANAQRELNAARRASDLLTSATSDAQIAKVEKLLGLADTAKNKQIVIGVETSAVQKAESELQTLFTKRDDPNVRGKQLASIDNQIASVQHRIELITGGIVPANEADLEVLRAITAEINAQTVAAEKLIPPFQQFVDSFDRTKSFGDTLGGLFEVNPDNVVQLNANLDNTSNIIRDIAANANAAFTKALGEGASSIDAKTQSYSTLWQQLELVQLTLGDTDAQFKSLLDTIGIVEPNIEGLSGSFTDVATKMGLPKQQLADILGLIGKIDPTINIAITVDAEQAIHDLLAVQAAETGITGSLASAADNAKKLKHANDVLFGADGNAPGFTVGKANQPSPSVASGNAAQKAADAVKNATDALAQKLQESADSIVEAAKAWVGSIKERTQYEASISAGTAIRNTQRQIKDLTEVAAGLTELRARGLSQQAIQSLGIDNVADVKQVRKLLRANPADLGALSTSVADLNKKAVEVATTAEDSRTRKNITEGILAAADTLGVDFTKADAAQLANTFNITATSNAEEIAASILSVLSGGKIGR